MSKIRQLCSNLARHIWSVKKRTLPGFISPRTILHSCRASRPNAIHIPNDLLTSYSRIFLSGPLVVSRNSLNDPSSTCSITMLGCMLWSDPTSSSFSQETPKKLTILWWDANGGYVKILISANALWNLVFRMHYGWLLPRYDLVAKWFL